MGRGRELSGLEGRFAAVAGAGVSAVVAVTGPAGIGKTRLVGELRRRTERRSAWLVGRAVAATSSSPLAAIREALPEAGATRVEVLRALAAAAAHRTAVLWLDDLHIADPATWELVNHIGRNPLSSPVLVLVTLRRHELLTSPDLALNVGTLLKDGLAAEVRIPPLATGEIGRLAELTLGRAAITPDLAGWLVDRTRGNPLLLTAVLDDLVHDPERPTTAETIQQRTRTLLATLSAAARSSAEAAAVLGGAFSAPDLLVLEPAAGEGLDELVGAALVVEDPNSRLLEFTHPIFQEAVYSTTGPGRRNELHRRAADRLPLRPAVRAYHLARSAGPGDVAAIAALREVASDAYREGSPRVAAARLREALDLAPAGERELRRGLLDELAGASDAAGDHTIGIPALRELLQLTSDRSEVATTRLRLASFLSAGAGELAEAKEHVEKAIAIYREDAPERLAAAFTELAWLDGEAGDLEGQVQAAREAAQRAAEDGRVQLHALGPLTHGLLLLGRETEAEEASVRATELAIATGDRGQQDWHRAVRSEVLAARGELDAAIALLEPLAAAERETADVVHSTLVRHLWLGGRWGAALASVRRLLEAAPARLPVRTAWAVAMGAAVEAGSGRPEAARQLLALADRGYEGRPFYCFSAWNDWAGGITLWLLGDPVAGLVSLRRSAQWLESMGASSALAIVLPDLCEVALVAGKGEVAGDAGALAALLAERTGLRLARAAAVACDAVLGRQPVGLAAEIAEAVGLRFLSARLLGYGGVEEVAESARRFAAMPALALEQASRDSLRALGADGRRAIREAGRLTGREEEVAQLARRGLSTRMIAGRLGISERTVESHLAHVYSKLGIAGRQDLSS